MVIKWIFVLFYFEFRPDYVGTISNLKKQVKTGILDFEFRLPHFEFPHVFHFTSSIFHQHMGIYGYSIPIVIARSAPISTTKQSQRQVWNYACRECPQRLLRSSQ